MPPTRRETPPASNFEALFQTALEKYSKRTGQGLVDHPLAAVLDRCDSPNAILAIFEEQARAFDEFRNGDPKLIKWLRPLVSCLHSICTPEVLFAGADIVSPVSVSLCFTVGLPMFFFIPSRCSRPLGQFLPALGSFFLCVSFPALSRRLFVISGPTRRPSM
jgi:hypothetical protein